MPDTMKNPISGRTRDEEISIATGGIGGRLPFDAWRKLIARGVVKETQKNFGGVHRAKKRKRTANSPRQLDTGRGAGDRP